MPTMMLDFTSHPNQRALSDSNDWRTVSTEGELETKRNKQVRYALIVLALLGIFYGLQRNQC